MWPPPPPGKRRMERPGWRTNAAASTASEALMERLGRGKNAAAPTASEALRERPGWRTNAAAPAVNKANNGAARTGSLVHTISLRSRVRAEVFPSGVLFHVLV